jgi:hypothetical protein
MAVDQSRCLETESRKESEDYHDRSAESILRALIHFLVPSEDVASVSPVMRVTCYGVHAWAVDPNSTAAYEERNNNHETDIACTCNPLTPVDGNLCLARNRYQAICL